MAQPICYGARMPTTTIAQPSLESCMELLRAVPAMTAFRRTVHEAAPVEARGWLSTLGVINRHPDGLRVSRAADLLHLDVSVVSRNVAELERLGYAIREPDPSDRRASVVFATDLGSMWIADFAVRFADAMRGMLVDWSDRDVTQLTELLHRLDASVQDATR